MLIIGITKEYANTISMPAQGFPSATIQAPIFLNQISSCCPRIAKLGAPPNQTHTCHPSHFNSLYINPPLNFSLSLSVSLRSLALKPIYYSLIFVSVSSQKPNLYFDFSSLSQIPDLGFDPLALFCIGSKFFFVSDGNQEECEYFEGG